MKIDARKSPEYSLELEILCFNCHVLLNGIEVRACIVADEEEGYIIKYDTPFTPDSFDNLKSSTHFGEVQIVPLTEQAKEIYTRLKKEEV